MSPRSKLTSYILASGFSIVITTADAQMIWRQQFGPHRVLLYKEVSRDFYYCTWAIHFDHPDISAFDLMAGQPLRFRIRWKTEAIEGVTSGLFLHVIVDGANFPFLITQINRERVLTDVIGEFGYALSKRSPADLWELLSKARTFRVYLPNGQYRNSNDGEFDLAYQTLVRCTEQAKELNKASN